MKQQSKILVVDDDPMLRKTLADILRIKGYDTVVAATGAEAVEAVQQNSFIVALIDLQLPDMAGLEVMARIKTISPLVEAIILTGHASMDTAIEATKQGAYSYLLKPYQMDELLRNIQQGIKHHQAQEEILRLASFPRLHPHPILELNAEGEVTYANPATEKRFPELASAGMAHPLLNGLTELIAKLRKTGQQQEIRREAELGAATYELNIYYVHEVDLIRVCIVDITQRRRAEESIRILAVTDSLTGITNRREFSRLLTAEVARTNRYSTPLALIMYDIDFFKRVNDTFGHDTGDAVLQAVTGIVRQHIRAVDTVARWGGEEFMVLMPQSNQIAGAQVAENLRQAIALHRFDKVNSITVSFGVTGLAVGDDLNSLLKRVDDALYLAKMNGRNRVEILSAADAAAPAAT